MDHGKCKITREDLLTILEQMHEGLSIEGPDGTILFMNESAERMFGVRYEDIKGMTGKDLEKNKIFNPVMSLKAAEKRSRVTERQKNRHGREYFVTSIPIMDEKGNVCFTVGYSSWDVSDTTELRNILEQLQAENCRMKKEVMFLRKQEEKDDFIVARDKCTQEAAEKVKLAAEQGVPVFISGEAGTGKMFMANQYHHMAGRSGFPVMALDLKYLETDPEEELYGSREKAGILELCDHGTLILNHIELFPKSGQDKLRRILSGEEFVAGDGLTKNLDVKIAALSELSAEELMQTGRLRPELFFALTIIPVNLHPICERPADLQEYIWHFLEKYNSKYRKNVRISDKALNILKGYQWKMNINEVKFLIERLVVTADRDEIGIYDLPVKVREPLMGNMEEGIDLKESLEFYEGEIIRRAYEKYKTTVGVARELNISQPSAARKVQKYVYGKI